MNNGTVIVLGASGDLATKKLLPALYRLLADRKVDRLLIVGAALDNMSAQELCERVRPSIDRYDDNTWRLFCSMMHYQQINIDDLADFQKLAAYIAAKEKEHSLSGNRLLYLAIAASLFSRATQNAVTSHLIDKKDKEDLCSHRVIYEKPFGYDSSSASATNKVITSLLSEDQIYRIDHYLTKELVTNIATLRFANAMFEPLWHAGGIEQVHIILDESQGVEGRTSLYESYGAMRDVVQNHMLEMLALVAMEPPARLHGTHLSKERAQVLKATTIVDGILGQCDQYRAKEGVASHSKTETFALLRLAVDNKRWAGVPFFFKTGKYLKHHATSIQVIFRASPFSSLFGTQPQENRLIITMAPEEIISLQLMMRKPGHTHELTPVALDFCHQLTFGPQTMQAYELLLDEVMQGERCSGLVHMDEISEAWRIVDHAYAQSLPLYSYVQGTSGPQEMNIFTAKNKIRWTEDENRNGWPWPHGCLDCGTSDKK